MPNSDVWKYSKGGVLSGRVSEQEVVALIRSGGLAADDLVYSLEIGSWQPVSVVAKVLTSREAPVTPTPPMPAPTPISTPNPMPAPMTDISSTAKMDASEQSSAAQPASLPAAQPAPSPADWKYSRNGKISALLPRDRLIALIHAGELSDDDQVWHREIGSWQPLSAVRRMLQVGNGGGAATPLEASTVGAAKVTVTPPQSSQAMPSADGILPTSVTPPAKDGAADPRRKKNLFLVAGAAVLIIVFAGISVPVIWWMGSFSSHDAPSTEPAPVASGSPAAPPEAPSNPPAGEPLVPTKVVGRPGVGQAPISSLKPGVKAAMPAIRVVSRTFRGHEGGVTAVLFDPQNDRVITGSNSVSRVRQNNTNVNYPGPDNTVRFWSLETGKQSDIINQGLGQRQTWGVQGITFSPDHSLLAVTTCRPTADFGEPTLTIWNANSEQRLHQFPLPGRAGAWAPWFSTDGKSVYAIRADTTVHVFDLESEQQICVVRFNETAIETALHCACMSSDRTFVFGGMSNGVINEWSLADPSFRRVFRGHTGLIHSVALTADDRYLVSAGNDGTARVWEVSTGKQTAMLSHGGRVFAAAFIQDATRVVTGGDDNVAILWNVANGSAIQRFQGHTDIINCLAVSSDGRLLVTGSADKTARTWLIEERAAEAPAAIRSTPAFVPPAPEPKEVRAALAEALPPLIYHVPLVSGFTLTDPQFARAASVSPVDSAATHVRPRASATSAPATPRITVDVLTVDAAAMTERPAFGLTIDPSSGTLSIEQNKPLTEPTTIALQLVDGENQPVARLLVATASADARVRALLDARKQLSIAKAARVRDLEKRDASDQLRKETQARLKQDATGPRTMRTPKDAAAVNSKIQEDRHIVEVQSATYETASREVTADEELVTQAAAASETAQAACKESGNP